jgi:photosystem II stability/assembly factor-like uncharacterized protein
MPIFAGKILARKGLHFYRPRKWRGSRMKLNIHSRQTSGLTIMLLLCNLACPAQSPGSNSWQVIGPGGGGTTIAPTISPHDPRLVVEHSDMTGGYVTGDNGQSWRMFNLHGGITAVAFDPADPKVIYTGNAALWRSSDSGQTWKMLFPSPARNTVEHQLGDHSDYSLTSSDPAYPGGDVSAIAIASPNGAKNGPASAEHFYLSFELKGHPSVIVSSADGGITWSRLATLPQRVWLLARQESGLIAVSGAAAWRIAPDGSTTQLGSIPTAVKAANSARSGDSIWIYATGQDGNVYLSEDSGQHFRPVTPALQQSAGKFEAIAASDGHPEVAYTGFRSLQLGTGKENLFNGIAKTTDGGQTWKIVFKESNRAATNLSATWIEQRATQDGISIWFDSPYSLGVAPTNPDVAYATDLFRTYRTLDGGATWQEMNSKRLDDGTWTSRGLDVTTNYGVQFDPFDSHHIYMDNTDMGLFQSTNGGQSWRSSTEGIPEDWRNTTYWLAFDPAQRGLVWGAFSGTHDLPRPKMWRSRGVKSLIGGIAVSTDGGGHWTPSITGMPAHSITHILLDPSSPAGSRTLYACAFGLGVYKSIDNGKSWTQKNNGIAGNEPFAWRITPAQDGALYLVVARRTEAKDYSLSGAGTLYRSTDKAEHWQRIDLPSGVTGPTGLEVDPRNPRRLYLTAWGQEGEDTDNNGGVYTSEDGGQTWRTLFTQAQHVYDLTIDPKRPDTLYICGFDAAAYRSNDRGSHWIRIHGYDFKWGHRIFLDPNDSNQIYITTYGGGVWHGPATSATNPPEAILTQVPIAVPDQSPAHSQQ